VRGRYGDGGYLNGVRPAVFVGNHQSELDVAVCGHVFPPYCSVTAKASLRFVPFLGWFSESLSTSRRGLEWIGHEC